MDQDIITHSLVKEAANHNGNEDREPVRHIPPTKGSPGTRPASLKPHEPGEKDTPKTKFGVSTRNAWTIEDDPGFWSTYVKEAGEYDKDLIEGWGNSLDIILIFAGLFSAINTAFIIESYIRLQPDTAEATLFLLRQILKHRNDDVVLSDADLGLVSSQPSAASLRVNSIFFASLSCSLIAAFGAVTAKQWLTQYTRLGRMVQLHQQGRRRHLKFKGLETWHFSLVMELLPASLQLSLLLFLWGLSDFLWPLSWKIGVLAMVFSAVGLFGYTASFVIAMVDPTSPFQTSLSNTLRGVLKDLAKSLHLISVHTYQLSGSLLQNLREFGNAVWRFNGIWYIQRIQVIRSFNLKDFGCAVGLMIYIGILGLGGWLHQRLHPNEEDPDYLGPSLTEEMDWDPKKKASAECVLWLFEQAERPDVTQRALNAMTLFPADRLLGLIKTREGLFDRLVTLYNSYLLGGTDEARSVRSSRLLNARLTGSALFHILNAAESGDPVCERILRSIPDSHSLEAMDSYLDITLRIIACGLDAQKAFGLDDVYRLKNLFSSMLSPQVASMQNQQSPSTIALVTTTAPFSLLLDIFIYSTRLEKAVVASTYQFASPISRWAVEYEEILGMICTFLETRPPLETISHIAIAVATLQWKKREHQLISWSYPPIHDAKTIGSVLKTAWHTIDKRKECLQNIIRAITLVGSADSPNTVRIYWDLIGLVAELGDIKVQPLEFPLSDDIPLAMLRIYRQLPQNAITQHYVLRTLRYPFRSKYISPLHEEFGQDIISLLKSVFYSETRVSEATRVRVASLLFNMGNDSDLMNILASPGGLYPYREGLLNNLFVTIAEDLSATWLCRIYLHRILLSTPVDNSTFYAVHRETLVHVLSKSDHLRPSQDPNYAIETIFRTMMKEDPSIRWPAYFVILNIISPKADDDVVDLSELPVQGDTSLVEDTSKRAIWTGEALLIIWDEVNKREHEESTYKVFFIEDAVSALLRYHDALQEKKITSPSEPVFRGYLERAREEVQDSEQWKMVDEVLSRLGESSHLAN